jgi:hypothetical protein
MSLWLEILKHVSMGDSLEAYRLLNFELPQVLRLSEVKRAGDWRYTGPVPKKVRIFIASLAEADRGMAKSRADDFVDYITDLIMAKVRRIVSLVEFCREDPKLSIEEIAEGFTGWDGLKKGKHDRAGWIRRHLRSISVAGIKIASVATEEACTGPTNEDENYGYHELALVNRWRAELSWKDFKESEEWEKKYPTERYYEPNFPVFKTEECAEFRSLCEEMAEQVVSLFEKRRAKMERAFRRTPLANQGWEFSDITQCLYANMQRGARTILEQRGMLASRQKHKNGAAWIFWAQEPEPSKK